MSYLKVLIVLILFASQNYIKADEESNLLTKLNCQPAEKRIFNYESNTQLWGPLEENFLVTAEVIVHCLGNDENGKYGSNGFKYMVEIKKLKPTVVREKQNEIKSLKRSKRSVGGWFKQAWTDVKGFFVNLFSKRKIESDDGFDIDLDKQSSSLNYQCKGTKDSKREKRSADFNYETIIYDKMFSTPFVFIQLIDGSIPEVRFSAVETDITVKNFKRHIADAFATQLDPSKQKVYEQSPIGAHISRYSYDNSGKLEESLQPNSDGSTLKLGGALIPMSLQSENTAPKTLSIMRDVTPDDVMQLGNGNSIVNDPNQMDINAKQIQQISEGRLTATAGHLSLSLISPSKNSRPKRSSDDNTDIEDYLKVRTKYSLSVSKKLSKRSTDNSDLLKKLKEIESNLNLKSETLISESSAVSSLSEKLITTRDYLNGVLGKDTNSDQLLKYSSDHMNPVYNTLLRALNLEVILNEDKTESSITKAIRHMGSEKRLNEVCGEDLSVIHQKCHDLLLILVKAQSDVTQTKLLKHLNHKTNIESKSKILELLVQSPKPPNSFIIELLNLAKAQNNDTNYEGILLLAISNLAHHSISVQIKDQTAQFLINRLDRSQCNRDSHNSFMVDILEAIGNLGYNLTIPYSIEIGETCSDSDAIRIAAIHSCRRLISDPETQKWFLKLLKEPKMNCVVKQEIVNILIEDINTIEMNLGSANRWPKIDFNEIDNVLSENLLIIKHNECLNENIVRYFERKNNELSKIVIKKLKKQRSKREVLNSFWTESHCKEWVPQNDKKVEPSNDGNIIISDKLIESEEVEPNVPYRKRRKCSASKRFGPNQAQAVFRADIVNDLSGEENKPEYKLMAQFVVGTHFLGKDIDIGKMYVYHRNESSRAYVNIFGNTLVDAARSSCDGTSVQPYSYTSYFPLYDFNLWIVQMTLGIRLTAEMNFDLPNFNCDSKKSRQMQSINLTPEARVGAAGEVSGKVLVMKGGMNIGGDFNYYSNLEFEPNPKLCLSVYNGYKPMNVSISSWYQFWHPTCSEWMDRNIWTPKSLNWQINDQHRSAWIQNECLLKDSAFIKKRVEP